MEIISICQILNSLIAKFRLAQSCPFGRLCCLVISYLVCEVVTQSVTMNRVSDTREYVCG